MEATAEAWEVFSLITTTWFWKEMYFLQDGNNNIVYSRASHKYMTFKDAVIEFCEMIRE